MNYKPILEFESFLNEDKKLRVKKDKKPWYLRLLPNEKPYNEFALMSAMSENIYLMADLHIGDPIENWREKRDKIISTINAIVKPDEHLLILGDLSAHTNTANMDDVRNTIAMINCKNMYLILGNNDQADIDTYVKMGFKTVTDRFVWKNYIFSHMPEKIYGNMINIHGHIHEEIQYIDVDWHNHINVWDNQYRPIRLKEVIHLFNSGYYKGVTINSKDELDNHKEEKYFGTEESVEILTETLMIAGEKIDKDRLNDEKYVKSLVEKINDTPEVDLKKKETLSSLISTLVTISIFIPITAPITLLIVLIVKIILNNVTYVPEKEMNKLIKALDKCAKKCSDPTIRQQILDNKHRLEYKRDGISTKDNKFRYFGAGNYFWYTYCVSNGCYIPSIAGQVLFDVNKMNKSPNFSKWDKIIEQKSGKLGGKYIEYLASIEDIEGKMDKNKFVLTFTNKPYFTKLSFNKMKIVRNKTVSPLVVLDNDITVYCHDDKCCYSYSEVYGDNVVQRISLDDVLSAANKTYTDYQRFKSEYRPDRFLILESMDMESSINISYSTDFNLAKSIYDKLSDEDKFFYLEGEPYTDKPNNIYRQVMLIDGVPAGFIEINTAVSRVFNYVGVVVSEAFRNQGVATTLFHKLLEDYDYKSGILMLWNAHIRNVKSQNLALRLGFDEIKSFTEDHKLYKMTTDTANTIKYLTELENRKNIDV